MKFREATFTKEELEACEEKGTCAGVKCGGLLDCVLCPLGDLTNEDALKYIREHIESED